MVALQRQTSIINTHPELLSISTSDVQHHTPQDTSTRLEVSALAAIGYMRPKTRSMTKQNGRWLRLPPELRSMILFEVVPADDSCYMLGRILKKIAPIFRDEMQYPLKNLQLQVRAYEGELIAMSVRWLAAYQSWKDYALHRLGIEVEQPFDIEVALDAERRASPDEILAWSQKGLAILKADKPIRSMLRALEKLAGCLDLSLEVIGFEPDARSGTMVSAGRD